MSILREYCPDFSSGACRGVPLTKRSPDPWGEVSLGDSDGMSLGLGDPLDRGAALKETEHVLPRKHGNFALRVPRGLLGLNPWGQGPPIPRVARGYDFLTLAENVSTWRACG
jgi:hypothetical protein